MKKHLHYLLILFLLLTGLSSKADARAYEVDGLWYDINTDDSTATLINNIYTGTYYMAEVIIPSSITVQGKTYRVTKLNRLSFRGSPNLKSITIPNTVTSIGWWCFKDCTNLTSIIIPNSVTELEDGCFLGSTSLTNITLSNSLTKLEWRCFEDCIMLKSITIPTSVTKLPDECFYNCRSLTNVTLTDSLTELGTSCFEKCRNLKSITLPETVTKVGARCFRGCDNLEEVTCLALTPPQTGYKGRSSYTSFEWYTQKKLYVPDYALEDYKNSYEWGAIFLFGIFPLSASGIKAISKDTVNVKSENGMITLSNVPNTVPVSVYSTSGQLLGSGRGNISVSAQGTTMVIVKVGGKRYKVLVK